MAVKFDKAQETKKRKGLKKYHVGKYVFNILQAPLVPIVWAADKITDYKYNKLVWSEEKATKMLAFCVGSEATMGALKNL